MTFKYVSQSVYVVLEHHWEKDLIIKLNTHTCEQHVQTLMMLVMPQSDANASSLDKRAKKGDASDMTYPGAQQLKPVSPSLFPPS